jgi:hypothetical protein
MPVGFVSMVARQDYGVSLGCNASASECLQRPSRGTAVVGSLPTRGKSRCYLCRGQRKSGRLSYVFAVWNNVNRHADEHLHE